MVKSNCSWGFNGTPVAKVRYPELAAGPFKAKAGSENPGLRPVFKAWIWVGAINAQPGWSVITH